MARVSRKNGVSEGLPKGQRQAVFRTALYVRLSVEDNGKRMRIRLKIRNCS